MSAVIKDVDNGYRELLKTLGSMKGSVAVGVDDRPHEPSGTPTDEIGLVHEFGRGNVPERSFLRAWVDGNKKAIVDKMTREAKIVVAGGTPWAEALAIVGHWAVAEIKDRIFGLIPPPLLEATIKRRAVGTTPLVDTQQLIDALVIEVDENKKVENPE